MDLPRAGHQRWPSSPRPAGDKEKLSERAGAPSSREDPSLPQANYDEETGQTIIAGMGELHLDIITTKHHA